MFNKKFIGLGGLPRSGSTLLSSILSQNPDIHSEGNSAVCNLMWGMQQSCLIKDAQHLLANNKLHAIYDLVGSIPNIYYKNVTASIVIDKCRSWPLEDNVKLLMTYFNQPPKVIVLERPLIEVVKSFMLLRQENNWPGHLEEDLLDDWSEPIIRSLNGIKWAKKNNKGQFLFVQYDDLVNNTKEVIKKIYEFCEIEHFEHHFDNIVNKYPENDEVYGLLGQHHVRPTISKRVLNIKVSKKTIKRCAELDL
jgi:sulfotransferase